MLNLDTKVYSPHSFRRGGATFAFQVRTHPLFIKCLRDWSSDAYLIYLTLSNKDKVTAMMKLSAGLQNIWEIGAQTPISSI